VSLDNAFALIAGHPKEVSTAQRGWGHISVANRTTRYPPRDSCASADTLGQFSNHFRAIYPNDFGHLFARSSPPLSLLHLSYSICESLSLLSQSNIHRCPSARRMIRNRPARTPLFLNRFKPRLASPNASLSFPKSIRACALNSRR
jgi:hypothetical protein